MIVDRYYYHQLNKDEQKIYRVCYEGVMAHKDVIPLPVRGKLPQDMIMRIFNALMRDNPLIYYVNQVACGVGTDENGNIALTPQYFFDESVVKRYNKKIQEVVNDLAEKLKLTEGTEYEKELKIHDWICENIEYDEDGHDINNVKGVILSHNIIGVFAHHKAQCEGIAKACKVLLNAVDIRCIVAMGKATLNAESMPHAWNIVNIDNKPYLVDFTWDIGRNDVADAKSTSGRKVYYDYFNVTDNDLAKNHTSEIVYPTCESMEMNYFVRNGLCFKSKKDALKYVEDALKQGDKDFYFRLLGRANLRDTIDNAVLLIKEYCFDNGIANVSMEKYVNDSLKICRLRIV